MPDFIPVRTERLFNRKNLYSEITWNDLRTAIAAFRARMETWYIRPAQKLLASSGHYSFSVVALARMLVDTLAQYTHNLAESKGGRFIDVLIAHDTIYATSIVPGIQYTFRGTTKQLINYAQAIWVCYRCGILHESHVMLCGVISGGQSRVIQQQPGLTRYANNTPCPTLILDPSKFLVSVESLFDRYIHRLRNSDRANNQLRRNFAAKFERSFGVPVPNTL
jgi:hypothetical protein